MGLKGKTAVITGAGRGIGAGIASFLYSKGADVVLADINKENAQKSAQELKGLPGRAVGEYIDVSDMDSIEGLLDKVIKAFGGVDILVNNAGVINQDPIPQIRVEDWDRVTDINLKGTFLCSKVFSAAMIKRGGGRIINISSLAG